ncbi:MAG: response regulator transcription factor [Planctomycetota bacterium]|nr:response regulator transcription factor [Planctomycetota bacterium]
MAGLRIVVIEDDPGTRQMTIEVLMALEETAEVFGAADVKMGLHAVRTHRPDLVLLDLNLGRRLDGLEVCREIRNDPDVGATPIIVFTSEPSAEVEPALLDAGADDYIRKPQFTPKLLASRVRAVLRRSAGADTAHLLRHGPLVLDSQRCEAVLDGRPLMLTPTEFAILLKLATNKDRALRRYELLEREGDDAESSPPDRTVDVHILGIRRKLGRHDWLIDTVFGVGYRLGAPPRANAR